MDGENPWTTLGTRLVYESRRLRLREDSVIRPDGSEGTYSVVELPRSVGVIALRHDGCVAMVSQWRYVHGKMSLEIPTGGAEGNETPRHAAERELKEETGVTAKDWTLLGSIDNSNGVTTDVAHLFLARELEFGEAETQPDEKVELVWLPFDEVFRAVMDGDVTESVSVAGILKVKLLME